MPVSLRPWRNARRRPVVASGDVESRNPTTGIAGCCPRARFTLAASSRPPPPIRVMNSRRFMSGMGDFLVWGFVCQGVRQTASFFLCFFVRSESPFLYLDQRFAHVGAHRIVAPTLWHASPLPGYTLTAPSTTARWVRSGDDQRGARFRGAINRATTLYPVGPGPEPRCSHAHRQRSSEPADPFSPSAYESQGSTSGPRHLEPSSATVTSGRPGPKLSGAFSVLRSMRRPQNDAVRHHAFSHQPPQGNQKLARQGHDHELASTTGVLSAGSKPLCQGAVLLEHEKSPRQLDHASSNPSVARTGQPFLPAFSATLVGRAREAGITRYGPSVAHVSRQHLLHQHVGGLDANPDHARQQAHHGMRSITGRLLETLQASILDPADLSTDEPPALHIAKQLGQRVGRDRLALGRAQAFFSLGLNPRIPSRINVAVIRLTIRLFSATRLSRSRLGRLASSSFIVGIATILQ